MTAVKRRTVKQYRVGLRHLGLTSLDVLEQSRLKKTILPLLSIMISPLTSPAIGYVVAILLHRQHTTSRVNRVFARKKSLKKPL